MQLHHNIDLFDDIAVNASESLNIDLEIIRKDYFVTLFLKEFLKLEPGVIFKGGTSLSKCYKIINRFSEDIDLSFHNNGTPVTANERRDINHHVQSTCEVLGFKITNESKIKSRAKLNIFRVNTGFTNDGIIASDILQEIVDKGVYESDYSTLASTLLFEDVSYEIAINAIKEIKKSRLFG